MYSELSGISLKSLSSINIPISCKYALYINNATSTIDKASLVSISPQTGVAVVRLDASDDLFNKVLNEMKKVRKISDEEKAEFNELLSFFEEQPDIVSLVERLLDKNN